MTKEIIIAIISAVVALISAIISIFGQIRIAQLKDQFTQQQEARSQKARSQALIAKYRDPLLRSAFDLQSRIYNITMQNFMNLYGSHISEQHKYCIDNTLYVIAEFLGWIEILRREVQFLDLGSVEDNQKLNQLLFNITATFYSEQYSFVFLLLKGQQRAIGELMMSDHRVVEQPLSYECIGYATFSQRLHEDKIFNSWFSSLTSDLECLDKEGKAHYGRLIVLQNTLIDLIDFLDPDKIRISTEERNKISLESIEKKKGSTIES